MEIDALEGMEGAGQNSSAAVDHLAESEDDLWFINYTRFMAYQRQIKCIELISEKIDTNAGFIVRCLFDLVEPQLRIRSTDEQRLQQIANISIPEEKLWECIQNAQLSEESPNITQTSLSSYLSLMTRDSARFLARTKLPPGVVISAFYIEFQLENSTQHANLHPIPRHTIHDRFNKAEMHREYCSR